MGATTVLSLENSSSILLRFGTTSAIKAQVEASRALCGFGGRWCRVGRECQIRSTTRPGTAGAHGGVPTRDFQSFMQSIYTATVRVFLFIFPMPSSA